MNCDPTLATQDVGQAWKVPKIMERNRCSEINLLHEAIHKYVQGGDLSEAQFAGLTGVLHLFLGLGSTVWEVYDGRMDGCKRKLPHFQMENIFKLTKW